jgi:hypothetical protein
MTFSGVLLRQDKPDMKQYGLVKPGEVSLIYTEGFPEKGPVPELPEGRYEITWIDIHTGDQVTEQVQYNPGMPLKVPYRVHEAVLKIVYLSP